MLILKNQLFRFYYMRAFSKYTQLRIHNFHNLILIEDRILHPNCLIDSGK